MMSVAEPEARFKPPAGGGVRMWLFNVVITTGFDNLMIFVILSNTVAMTLVHADMSNRWKSSLEVANVVFTGIFFVEMILKWFAVGLRAYFKVGLHKKNQTEKLLDINKERCLRFSL